MAPLGVDDFLNKGRDINWAGFNNLKSGISPMDLLDKYGKGGHMIFTRQQVEGFMAETVKESEALIKGGDQKGASLLEKAKQQIGLLIPVDVRTDEGVVRVYVMEKAVDDKLEKGQLSEALMYGGSGNSNVSFDKSGKEIKEKVTTLAGKIDGKITEYKGEMAALVTKIGFLPTEEMDEYEMRGMPDECRDKKRYNWSCVYFEPANTAMHVPVSSDDKPVAKKSASTQEEADNCRNYNNVMRKYCECLGDKLKAEVFLRNINEKKSYTLSLPQLAALGF